MKKVDTTNPPKQTEMKLSDLNIRPEDFQFRAVELDRYHADELEKALQQGRDVGPLDVWQDPNDSRYYILDGHHRYEAYRRLRWTKPIKVLIHEGPLHEVKLVALRENTKARLPMSHKERADAAWRLTVAQREDRSYSYSKRELAEATGVSERTVATMRTTYTKISELGLDHPASWAAAIEVAKGNEFEDMTDDERELWIEAKAGEIDKAIGKPIAEYTKRYPEAVHRVLERRMGQEFGHMIRYYASQEDYYEDDEDNFPF